MHYRCKKNTLCAECIFQSALAGEPPLNRCGTAHVYSQIEGNINGVSIYFPQIELLEELVRSTNATFILPFRTMKGWYRSISNWPPSLESYHLKDRLRRSNITGMPFSTGDSLRVFSNFFCGHVQRVRDIVPPDRLVEIDIEDPTTGSRLADIFDLDEACWGQSNINANIHPELGNQTKGRGVDWLIQGKKRLRGKNGIIRMRYDNPLQDLGGDGGDNGRLNSSVVARPTDNKHNKYDVDIKERGASATMSTGRLNLTDEQPMWVDSRCQELIAHENGHWHHQIYSQLYNSNGSLQERYFPRELNWLKQSDTIQRTEKHLFGTCALNQNMLMYTTSLGHQCGCATKGFVPTHSTWVYNDTSTSTVKIDNDPALRLAYNLAKVNATLCYSGDSIDYQIYKAFHNNLKRVEQLQRIRHPDKDALVSIMTREVRVHHATKPGTIDEWFLHG